MPTENEWYKAALYSPVKGGVGSPGDRAYSTQSDTAPGNVIGSGANQANYYTGAGFSVTQSPGFLSQSQNYLTDVGAFTNSASYYGTFDQSGNLNEWNDLNGTAGGSRGIRGGNWISYGASNLLSSFRTTDFTYGEEHHGGFRLAGSVSSPSGVPEIDPAGLGSVLALVTGSLGLLERRRRDRR